MYRGYTCLHRKVWSNAVLAEPGKRFSRLEAWLYITNVLATGMDDPGAGLKRGEFVASIRQLAECFNWSRGAVLRFFETLLQNSMIMRVGHSAGQEAGHFSVCNYVTYNPSRNTERDTQRDTQRDTFKEVLKESIKKEIKDTSASAKASAGLSPKILVDIFQQNNQSLPEVKALTSERLKKCRLRINRPFATDALNNTSQILRRQSKKPSKRPSFAGKARAVGGRASTGLLPIR